MRTTLLLTAVISITMMIGLPCCKKDHTPQPSNNSNVPQCINTEIQKMQSEEVRNPAGSVWKYTYNGQTVYFIPASCCDMPSVLYNSNCEIICHPDGGITGNGDGQCTDFFTTRQNETLVWQDGRTN